MNSTYDPFYYETISTTEAEDESTELYAWEYEDENWSWQTCADFVNFSEYYSSYYEGVHYSWNGLPIRSNVNDSVNLPVAAFMALLGIIGVCLNVYCVRTTLQNRLISKAIKCYLLFDCYCRLNEAWTLFYKTNCILSWDCVNPDGLLSGFVLNRFFTSFNLGMQYSMQMLGNGLCCNRFFAVFFEGRYYSRIERIAFPHALILWILPIIAYIVQIGNRVNPTRGFTCYGGWYFSPLEYCNTWGYSMNTIARFVNRNINYTMYGIFGVTMLFDSITLWKVRRLRKGSESKKRADVRLSILLVTTHIITACFFIGKYLANYTLPDVLPIYYFLILEVLPFLVHCLLGIILIIFNLENKRRSNSMVQTVSMVALRRRSSINPSIVSQFKIPQ